MSRYTSATDDDRRAMLDAIGAGSVDALFDEVVPPGVRLGRPLDLPPGKPEQEVYAYLRDLGLVRRVRRQHLGARQDRVDDRRDVVVVHARAEERDLVLG